MKNLLKLLLLTLILGGCSGGFNCPFDKPDCCDNILFGCGTFDLPSGCSCDDYFFSVKRAQKSNKGNFAGPWSVELQKSSSSCPGVLPTASGRVSIVQQGNKITVKVPQYGTLRGTARANSFQVSGTTSQLPLSCSARVRVNCSLSNRNTCELQAKADVSCPFQSDECSVSYTGKATRVAK